MMARRRLLDLFCGAGGGAAGYVRAGFDVVGVDINPKAGRHFPYEFVMADAMTYPLDGFDAVHASPPCNDHSPLRHVASADGSGRLLAETRARLAAGGVPYVIENVGGAEMPGSLVLCGTEFGLTAHGHWLRRHRRFEASIFLMGAGGCYCAAKRGRIAGVYGEGTTANRGTRLSAAQSRDLMGIDWMTRDELAQAIPPAYTEFIGEQLMRAIDERERVARLLAAARARADAAPYRSGGMSDARGRAGDRSALGA